MVPIPADPQRDLEDESIAVISEASLTGNRPLKRLLLLWGGLAIRPTSGAGPKTERSVL
jgi:hypothetical protein